MLKKSPIQLPLGDRPRIVNCGMGEHGLHGSEKYELPRLWCLHLYFYDVELEADGQTFAIVSGSLTLTPPRTKLVYKYQNKRYRHYFVHFSVNSRKPRITAPLLQHLPDARDEILDRLQNMHRLLAHNRLHAETLFWGLLWDIAEAGQRVEVKTSGENLLKAVEAFIEESLPKKVTVADVADQVGLSPTHVNRVVKSLLGLTTIQFIKKHRLQRAYRLLIHSTMPVKLIASECGIEDLQQFNKLLRAAYGKSPRQLREQMSGHAKATWALDRE